jgi:hypothetical protein
MVCFAVLGVVAWRSLSDDTLRVVTLAVIGSFAARTYLSHRQKQRAGDEAVGSDRGGGLK